MKQNSVQNNEKIQLIDVNKSKENIESDSDECNTVVEHNCDNDYSLICNSINATYL